MSLGWGVAAALTAVLFSTRSKHEDLHYWRTRAIRMQREADAWKSEAQIYCTAYHKLRGDPEWAPSTATSSASTSRTP